MWAQMIIQELRQLRERCQEKAEIQVHPNASIFNSAIRALFFFHLSPQLWFKQYYEWPLPLATDNKFCSFNKT